MKGKLFTKKRLAVLLVGAFALAAAGTAFALTSGATKSASGSCPSNFGGPFKTKTEIFNPGNTPMTLASDWVKGAGEQSLGDPGIVFVLNQTTSNTSADATISPVTVKTATGTVPIRLCSLGFDRMLGTHCGAGSPGFDVELVNNGVYRVPCNLGTHSPAVTGWEKITFSDADVQHLSGPAWPNCFSSPSVPSDCGLTFLQLLDDEGPSIGDPRPDYASPVAIIDNIVVNDYTITKG